MRPLRRGQITHSRGQVRHDALGERPIVASQGYDEPVLVEIPKGSAQTASPCVLRASELGRLGVAISVAAPGGETRLTALDHDVATVDWLSDPLQVNIVHRATATERELTLSGVENFGFRLLLDARTGVLQRATTTADALDLIKSMPACPLTRRRTSTQSATLLSIAYLEGSGVWASSKKRAEIARKVALGSLVTRGRVKGSGDRQPWNPPPSGGRRKNGNVQLHCVASRGAVLLVLIV